MARPTMLKLAFVIALSMAFASAAGATDITSAASFSGANLNVGGSSFSASTKVSLSAITNATNAASFDGQAYSIRSWHSAGDKTIAGKSGDSRMYFATTTPGNASANSGVAVTDDYSASSGTWVSM